VLEQAGDGLAAEHFWAFGTYSDMQREFREAPRDATLASVLLARPSDEANARWACVLSHLVPPLAQLCGASVQEAYAQVRRGWGSGAKGQRPVVEGGGPRDRVAGLDRAEGAREG